VSKNEVSGPAIYVASPLGFSEPGSEYLAAVLHPAILAAGFSVLDPWSTGAGIVNSAGPDADPRALNAALGAANAALITECAGVLAVLDGSDVDSGTAAEIGFASALRKLIVGLRTDFRMAGDNPDTPINLQVLYFIEISGGAFTTSIEHAIGMLANRLTTARAGDRLFHLASREMWASAKRSSSYEQSTRDQHLNEVGFIHCSYLDQVLASADRFYAGVNPEDLVVLVIDPARLDAELIIEPAANGEMFPHIYGPLNPSAVIATRALEIHGGHFGLGRAARA